MSMSLTATASTAVTAVLVGQVSGVSAEDGNNELVLEGLMIFAVTASATLTLLCCLGKCFTNLCAEEQPLELTPELMARVEPCIQRANEVLREQGKSLLLTDDQMKLTDEQIVALRHLTTLDADISVESAYTHICTKGNMMVKFFTDLPSPIFAQAKQFVSQALNELIDGINQDGVDQTTEGEQKLIMVFQLFMEMFPPHEEYITLTPIMIDEFEQSLQKVLGIGVLRACTVVVDNPATDQFTRVVGPCDRTASQQQRDALIRKMQQNCFHPI